MIRQITDDQLRELLAYACHVGNRRLAAAASRALDGDSLYDRAIREGCASVYAGARKSKEFAEAQRVRAREATRG